MARLAQLVEQRTENPCVRGSIPRAGTTFKCSWLNPPPTGGFFISKKRKNYQEFQMKKILLSTILSTLFLVGCASRSSIPQSSAQVDFNGKEGKIGWSQYAENARFKNVSLEKFYEAAKSGMAAGGFTLKESNQETQTLVGEHGMTANDWNIYAGIYYKQDKEDIIARVQVQGSKDFGFNGDATGYAWTGKIMNGIRTYLK